jgi:pilus assembly protein Flp/PilA
VCPSHRYQTHGEPTKLPRLKFSDEEVVDSILAVYVRAVSALQTAARREEGQGLTEYALILALIAIVAIVALKCLGGKVTSALTTIASSI